MLKILIGIAIGVGLLRPDLVTDTAATVLDSGQQIITDIAVEASRRQNERRTPPSH